MKRKDLMLAVLIFLAALVIVFMIITRLTEVLIWAVLKLVQSFTGV